MDYCDVCFDPPRPLTGTVTGAIRFDAVEGSRRLLGELEIQAPARLHYVEVAARERVWDIDERRLRSVTVYNRSSLPMALVRVSVGAALAGTVRINGLPEPEADPVPGVELPGLGPGCAAALTWEEAPGIALTPAPAKIYYEYQFAGDTLTGSVKAVQAG